MRVVYDGPAYAGKTTNLRNLAQSLGSKIYSGEEAEGRTLYFDWVDYVGGLFEGMPIRCQIISVPGQRVLERRRRLLLETADVVVFVADSRPQQLAENVRSFAVLQRVMAPATPPVGLIVQANKRDLEDAITVDALRDAMDSEGSLAMTEAVAERGDGVRDTFVLGVRLALDRVRELWDRNALPTLRPGIDDGDQLLAAVQAAERGETESLSIAGLGAIDRRSPPEAVPEPQPPPTSRTSGPPFPDASIPPGLVWPPVEGRIAVHESARGMTRPERSRNGDWIGLSNEWKLRAPLEGLFFDLDEARNALVDWARWHAAAGVRLSGPRALALVPESPGVWRLWQIVRRVPSLRDAIRQLFAQPDDTLVGERLLQAIDLRLRAERELIAAGWLGRLDLDSIGASKEGEPFFTGFCPFPGGSSSPAASAEPDEDRLVSRELGPLVRDELGRAPRRIPAVLESLQNAAAMQHRQDVAAAIQRILLGQ
ncbi:MAG: GTPase domain-containing protein [Acidobacteriota bacterium]